MIQNLETRRLILRKFEYTDASDCFAFLSDKETCLADGGYLPFLRMDEEYDALMNRFALDNGRLMIYSKEYRKVIGTIHIMNSEEYDGLKEIGYVISPAFRRKGYAFEALSNLIDSYLRAESAGIVAGIMEDNTASQKLIAKLGFTFTKKIENGIHHAVLGYIPLLYYTLNYEA